MSDSQLKPIKINPELFTLGARNVKNKTLKKTKTNIQPNKLKQNLLSKIKNYRKNKLSESNDKNEPIIISNPDVKINKISDSKSVINSKPIINQKLPTKNNYVLDSKPTIDDDDFTQSINYLKKLSTKSEKPSSDFPLKSLNDIKNNNAPQYGCMKNGSLPTYREWKNKTLKKSIENRETDNRDTDNRETENRESKNRESDNRDTDNRDTDNRDTDNRDTDNRDTDNRETENRETENRESENRDNLEKNKPPKYKLSKRSTTLKYYLGKRGRSVGVLVKNATTRKKIMDEHNLLRQTKLSDMKNYLKRHNLLKSGSRAPPDIIKKMYEQSLLGGDIRNSNKNNVIHNYLAE